MGREYFINCTNKAGEYVQLHSTNLKDLLNRRGSVATSFTLGKINERAAGIVELDGYSNNAAIEDPVAFRYVPMHLSKLEDMPVTFKPVYCVSVSGDERTARGAQYSCVSIMDKDTLTGENNSEYLTQIFGTHIITWQEMKNFRLGREDYYWQEPAAVKAEFTDLKAVLFTIDALYENKDVVIKLEKKAPFNRRAKELLLQIYSLMDPRLAIETGFCAYEKNIEQQIRVSGIRIFVVPGEVNNDQIPSGCTILDMDEIGSVSLNKDSKVIQCLINWVDNIPDEVREEALAGLFTEEALTEFYGDAYDYSGYIAPKQFLEVSEKFFEDYKKFEAFRSGENVVSLASLKDVLASFDTGFPLANKATKWYKEKFTKAVKSNKGCQKAILADISDAFSGAILADRNETDFEMDDELVAFGISMLNDKNLGRLAIQVEDKSFAPSKEMYEDRMAKQESKHGAEIEAKNQELLNQENDYKDKLTQQASSYEEKLARKDESYHLQIADLQAAHNEKVNDLNLTIEARDQEIVRQSESYEAKLTEKDNNHKSEIADLQTKHDEKVKELDGVIEARDQELISRDNQHKEELARQDNEHKLAVLNLNKEHAEALETKVREIADLNRMSAEKDAKITLTENQRDALAKDKENLETVRDNLTREKNTALEERDNAKIALFDFKAESERKLTDTVNTLKAEHGTKVKALNEAKERALADLNNAIDEKDRAVREEADRLTARFNQKIAAVNTEKEEAQKKYEEEKSARAKALKEKDAEMETQRKDYQGQINKLTFDNKKLKNNIRTLEEQGNSAGLPRWLVAVIGVFASLLAAAALFVFIALPRYNESVANCESLNEALADLESQYETLEEEAADSQTAAEEEIGRLTEENERLQSDLETVTAERDDLKSAAEQTEEQPASEEEQPMTEEQTETEEG